MPNIKELVFLNVRYARKVLRALDHKLRREMIERIIDMGNKVVITDLYVHMRMEQSVCSQHLAILRDAGIVTTERNGKFIIYSVKLDRIDKIDGLAQQMLVKKIAEPISSE